MQMIRELKPSPGLCLVGDKKHWGGEGRGGGNERRDDEEKETNE